MQFEHLPKHHEKTIITKSMSSSLDYISINVFYVKAEVSDYVRKLGERI